MDEYEEEEQSEEAERPGDVDYDQEDELDEDEDAFDAAEGATSEEEEYEEEPGDEEGSDDAEYEGAVWGNARPAAAAPGKRKRSTSGAAGGSQLERAVARRSLYIEDSDEEEDEEEGYVDEQEEEVYMEPPAPRPPLPKSLKLKIKVPASLRAAPHPQPMSYAEDSGVASDSAGGFAKAPGGGQQVGEEEADGYLDWDDPEADAKEAEAKKRRRVAHVLLSNAELAGLDDEVERVISHREVDGATATPADPWACREFFVKWARHSHIHCSWDTYATLSQLGGFKRVLNYCRKADAAAVAREWMGAEEREEADIRVAMEEELVAEHSQVERVFAGQGGGSSPARFLCKWRGLPYGEATWEAAEDLERIGAGAAVTTFVAREKRAAVPRRTVDAARRSFAESGQRAFMQQPDYLQGGGQLRDYQLDGLNWMVYSWAQGTNGILADEMGLGKTVQCASMVGYLAEAQQIGGPFIIIVPLSVVPNWAREFQKWVPQVNCIVYVGDAASREVIRRFEFPPSQRAAGRPYKFDAIITTYEIALKDAALLRSVRWSYLMVDEAHRLKNDESALYRELSQWSFKSKLLITGTPLQNNIRELWALLHFLQPAKFPSSEAFEAAHDMRDPAGVARLHAVLRPHLLRRVIKDVEKSLPPKNERILRVPMTPLQRQYYRWILTRNFKELNKNGHGQVTLLNVLMDLKKCCNHPFLFESAQESYRSATADDEDVATRLVVTSGKMVLLDKLLRRLKETGHRVLIFSQMVRVLDIISDYMRRRGYRHQRLDGSTPAHARHQAMERFNAPGSEDFAFLLSTRAGGLGINLATADTVLLFDSDWNPQNDLQAMSRAHRIGQKDIVNIYRLVTSGSVEEDILERAKRKMVLDHLVIQRMDTSGRTVLDPGAAAGAKAGARMFGKDELAAILRFGAADLFKEDDKDVGEETVPAGAAGAGLMSEEDLDAILARAEVVEDSRENAPGDAGGLLSSFNVATFQADEDDAAFWSRLIPEHMRPKVEPEASLEPGIRAARLKTQDGLGGGGELTRGDAEHNCEDGGGGGGDSKRRRVEGSKRAQPGPVVEGALLRVDRWPQAVDGEGRLTAAETAPRPASFPATLSRRDATFFVRAVKRHGLASKLPTVVAEAGGALPAVGPQAQLALWHGLLRACEAAVGKRSQQRQAALSQAAAMSGADVGAAKPLGDARLDFFGMDVRAAELLSIVRQMGQLESRLASVADPAKNRGWLSYAGAPPATLWMRSSGWVLADDAALLLGALRYGIGAWDKMAEDPDLLLGAKLAAAAGHSNSKELPKPSHLETRVLGLLRHAEKAASRPPKPPARLRPKAFPRPAGLAAETVAQAAQRAAEQAVAQAEVKAANDRAEALLGAEAMVLVRKLRTLQRRGAGMEESLVVNKTRKYMDSLGRRINEVTAAGSVERAALWSFVSRFTENLLSGQKLQSIYGRLHDCHSHHSQPHHGDDKLAAAPGGGDEVVASTAGLAEELI